MRNRQPWRPSLGVATGVLAGLLTAAAHAGDLLRGGAAFGQRNGAAAQQPGAAAAAAAKANAADILARTTQAVQSVQNLQQAANNLSQSANNAGLNPKTGATLPNVPNGLTPGGLQVAPGATPGSSLWQGANLPTQSTSGGNTNVSITQFQPTAILNWTTFNIGSHTKLQFDQDLAGGQTSEWIAFNIVNDPSGVPSQILGSIQANGQVFVVNRNGIIFGGGSQVNTHALFASSLPINNSLITSGLLVNPSAQFLFSSGTFASNSAFTAPATPDGDVLVEAGAQITSPTSAAHVGGRVVLAGPNVTNDGTITTPDGQTILAAGQQVGFQAHPGSDPTLRGLDAYVGAVTPGSGTATNNGIIEAPRADTMITGAAVNQNGVIDSSTSVTLNGRVDLLAEYGATAIASSTGTGQSHLAPMNTGSVTFGAGSVTQILPEWSSAETNVGAALPLPSQVVVQGHTIHMASDAILLAPGATPPTTAAVDLLGNALTSGVTFEAGTWFSTGASSNPLFFNTSGQILLDGGATINVAGSTDVAVPVSQNILNVTLLGNELANSPTQRQNTFRGVAIDVDLRETGSYNGQFWVGTPLANLQGYLGLVQKTVGQLSVDGGTVSLSAGGSVILQSGSNINVSGGYINYQGGMVQTTRVMTADGQLVDISNATPDQQYLGVYTGRFTTFHAAWGVSDQFTNPLAMTGAHFESNYVQGGNGGSISITAPTMALDGTLLGNVINGPHQLRTTSTAFNSTSSDTASTSTSSTPAGLSSLSLSFVAVDQTVLPTVLQDFPQTTPTTTPPNVIFENGLSLSAANPTNVDATYNLLLGERGTTVVLSPDLFTQNGFGNLTVNDRDGNITIPQNVNLKAQPGGSITLSGVNITVAGNVTAPGGNLTFNVNDFSARTVFNDKLAGVTPSPNPSFGNFTLAAGTTLSTAGLVVNDRENSPTAQTQQLAINGGSVTINTFNAALSPGSVIDVSGGADMAPSGSISYGNGGSITINTGKDISLGAVLGGMLQLGSQLKGYSAGGGSNSVGTISGGGNGGSLSIQATLVQIGGIPTVSNTLYLSPQFFNQGGFGSFTLTALGEIGPTGEYLNAIDIAPGTVIAPAAESRLLVSSGSTPSWEYVEEPLGIRTPVNLTFNAAMIEDPNKVVNGGAVALTRGDFVLGAGAVIRTDPLGSVTINTQTAAILGSIIAPGGAVSITTKGITESVGGTIVNPAGQLLAPLNANVPDLDLGPHSVISTAGTIVLLPNRQGYSVGSVLAGGSVALSGNIVAEAGSLIDVSGTSGVLDLPPADSNMSAPLLGALSGQQAVAQTRISAPTFNGTLLTSLPNGTTTASALLPIGSFTGTPVTPTFVASNGGSISLTGDTVLLSDATLRGAAGGPQATGGSLTVQGTLTVAQSGSAIPNPNFYQPGLTASLKLAPAQATTGQTAIGQPVSGPNGALEYFAANNFLEGGFDNLTLGGGAITFSGPVSITARGTLSVGSGGIIVANSTVNLSAPYVVLGTPFVPPGSASTFTTAASYGPGQLNVTAQFIDVGNLALQNIGQTTFTAINGDIRGDGTLNAAGSLILQAGQIYPASETTFSISVSDYTLGGKNHFGTLTILGGGLRQLPLSAAGTLDLAASIINQGGTLRAPLGSINLGTSTTQQVNLLPGSITSVSAIDPTTGQGVTIPYGLNVNGTTWIDPAGNDITSDLVPQKSITINGINVNAQPGSLIDIRGGGDLLSYQFVSGVGGTNDLLSWNFVGAWSATTSYQATQIVNYKGSFYYATVNAPAGPPAIGPDWNKVTPSYAVIPGYQFAYAPYAPYNNLPTAATNLGADQGYVSNLSVGSSIFLSGVAGLKAGVYTLLPARYAVLPGSFLVTPLSTASVGTYTLTDNSSIAAGYRLNTLDQSTANPSLYTTIDIASSEVVDQRVEYTTYSANEFLANQSQVLGLSIPRLPTDAGSLVLSGSTSLTVEGNVDAEGANGGRGGDIDLSTTATIIIGGPGGSAPKGSGDTYLNATLLNSYGAESFLIGGTRQNGTVFVDQSGTTATGTVITVNTSTIIVDNAGAPLIAPEIILAANKGITMDPGASIEQQGTMPQGGFYPSETLLIGNVGSTASTPAVPPVSGDGVLLRVGANNANVIRSNVNSADAVPNITIGANAMVSGQNILIDSTAGGSLDPTAMLSGQNIAIRAGTINLLLNQADTPVVSGINLGGTALNSLLGANVLSLTGYNSIDIYGPGTIASGNLAFHTGSLCGFADSAGDTVSIDATSLTLDNNAGQTGFAPNPVGSAKGSLAVNAGTIYTGANTLSIDQYANVTMTASTGVVLQNTGGIISQTNLSLTTPIIVGSAGASQTITAQNGSLDILAPAAGGKGNALAASAGLGATLNLNGQGIIENSRILLPSGLLNITDNASTAAAGGISVGGTLDVSGEAIQFYDTIEYTPGGNINLSSANGSVVLAAGSTLSVAANAGGSNAGSIFIGAPNGDFTLAGTLLGQGGAGGTNGSFAADFSPNFNGSTPTYSMASLDGILNAGGFTQSRAFRMRTGNVDVDGTANSLNYTISADNGSIEVTSTGDINASGNTGGSIILVANGSVTLDNGAILSVAAKNFNNAGEGGSITLEAGAATDASGNFVPNLKGAVVINSGATIDLSVASLNSLVSGLTPAQLQAMLKATAPSLSTANGGLTPPLAITQQQLEALPANTLMALTGLTPAQVAALSPDQFANLVDNLFGLSPAQIAALTPTQIAGLVYGDFTGTLHIRSPMNATGTGFAINPTLNGNIIDPSAIVVEGYQIYDLTGVNGQITGNPNQYLSAADPSTLVAPTGPFGIVKFTNSNQDVEDSVAANGQTFGMGISGLYSTSSGLLANNLDVQANNANGVQLSAALEIVPGAELVNTAVAAPDTYTLKNGGGVTTTSTGGTFYAPTGTSGNDQITSTVAYTVTSASGATQSFKAGQTTTIAAGSTVTLTGAGKLSFSATITSDSLTLDAAIPGLSVTTSGSVTKTAATGNITLGSTALDSSANPALGDWDLSETVPSNFTSNFQPVYVFRYGPNGTPGVLTFQASNNLIFYNSLSDGFDGTAAFDADGFLGQPLYTAPLLSFNPLLPANAQTYSYNFTAGADFSAANNAAVVPQTKLPAPGTGTLMLGKIVGANGTAPGTTAGGVLGVTNPGGTSSGTANAQTSTAAEVYGQMIRTGSGSIDISTTNNVELMNNLASVYTAGTAVINPNALPDGIFDSPNLFSGSSAPGFLGANQEPFRSSSYQGTPQYSLGGGNITIDALGTIEHVNLLQGALVQDSSKELPDDWLGRRDIVTNGQFAADPNTTGALASTTWWVDFTNFFEGVGALGGGNITMVAGGDIDNVDAVIPTNARAADFTDSTKKTAVAPSASNLYELGGGDLVIKAGGNINAGVYYAEAGTGTLTAGKSIITNATRTPSIQNITSPTSAFTNGNLQTELPTTLFLGGNARDGASGFSVFADQNVLLGPVSDVFLLPESMNNLSVYRTYFTTYAATDYVNVSSLGGNITFAEYVTPPGSSTAIPFLQAWAQDVLGVSNAGNNFNTSSIAYFQPWLRLNETFDVADNNLIATNFSSAFSILPPTLDATAFTGNINLQGNLTLMPSPTGTVDLLAGGQINGLQSSGVSASGVNVFIAGAINLSGANPANVYGVTDPLAILQSKGVTFPSPLFVKLSPDFSQLNEVFGESGQTTGLGNSPMNGVALDYGSPIVQDALNDPGGLHTGDPDPVRLYTLGGSISNLTLFSSKRAEVLAGQDISNDAFYIQNLNVDDISVVSAGGNINLFVPNTALANLVGVGSNPTGDVQISGPGTLEVLAGGNLNLGGLLSNNIQTENTDTNDGIGLGITSVGNARNPFLTVAGANVITAAGVGGPGDLSGNPNLNYSEFGTTYLKNSSLLGELGLNTADLSAMSADQQAVVATDVFFLVLRDAGRAHTAGTGTYSTGFDAISKLFGSNTSEMGNVILTSREIATANGGEVDVLAPNGDVTVGFDIIGQALSQGIITQDGGDINIFSNGNVSLGTSRIFTLRGGNIIIWSSNGSIAAGSASKTVKAAPPTQVLVDAASADVKTDLAGLATGGGIGVLATVEGVPPGNVDLVAPTGVVDAGDAGIRATGNLNIAATKVLNASNIQVSGTSTGTPTATVVAAPNVGGLSSASAAAAASNQAASDVAKNQQPQAGTQAPDADSTITVEVVGYGGGDGGGSNGDNTSGPAQ